MANLSINYMHKLTKKELIGWVNANPAIKHEFEFGWLCTIEQYFEDHRGYPNLVDCVAQDLNYPDGNQ